MAINPKAPIRTASSRQDLGSIEAIAYNDAAGSRKVIIVDAPVSRVVAVNENVGAGKFVRITGSTYTLDLIGKDYNASNTYQRGDVVANGSYVYLCQQDSVTGTFDASKWMQVADKQIASIPVNPYTVVTTGRWHNTVTVAGFLIDDESSIPYTRIRD